MVARPAAAAPLSENDLRGALAHPDEVAPLYRLLQGAEAALRLVEELGVPAITNGNIYAPVLMIAEKAADMILGD